MKAVVKSAIIVSALLALLISAVWSLYRPGINSTFFFDDFPNISQLQSFDLHGFTAQGFLIYIDNAPAGPLKRPVATLSFLLDDDSWPTQPYLFKITNIKLHILAGLTLLWLLWKISSMRGNRSALWLAWLGSAIWLVHPYQVSTVLYSVQRMTILAAIFCLAAILAYCYGRELVQRGRYRAGYTVLIVGVNLFFLLSLLSKENGMLTFWLILIVDRVILGKTVDQPNHSAWRWYWRIFILLPSIILALGMAKIAYQLILAHGEYGNRGFTAVERLLTESRIIWNYLYDLAIPKYETRGLFAQNYPLSKSLFNPLTTIFSMAGLLVVVLLAVVKRHAFPVLAGAILFYFVAHVLESTYFGLELYFEHRNYLASMLLFFAVVYTVNEVLQRKEVKGVKLTVYTLGAMWLGFAAFLLHARATLWANEPALVSIWAKKNPESSRALLYASQVMLQSGYIAQGRDFIENARAAEPLNPIPMLHAAIFNCRSDARLRLPEKQEINALLVTQPFAMTMFTVLRELVDTANTLKCDQWTYAELNDVVDAYFTKRKSDNPNEDALGNWLKGYNAILNKRGTDAAAYFKAAALERSDVSAGLGESAMLASLGDPIDAIKHLDLVEVRNSEVNLSDSLEKMARYRWIESEVKRLRNLYQNEVKVPWRYAD